MVKRTRRGTPRSLPSPALLCTLTALLLGTGCAGSAPETGPSTPSVLPSHRAAFARALGRASTHRAEVLRRRDLTHRELWEALEGPLASDALRVTEPGVSVQGRPIRSITFGRGPVRVLLWSQMHGDESTATMALADIMHWMAGGGPDPLRDRLAASLTVVMVPMLNPDGAQRFQRRNALAVDINRDARQLATPEGRILKALRDRLEPDFGFNLHDQNPHTLAGPGGRRAAFALLAPAYDQSRSYDEVRSRARKVAAVIAGVLQEEVPGRVARYSDAFNERAFGDLMQRWGTSTVLIESGVLPGDPDKQRLRGLNAAAILTALGALADGSFEEADIRHYEGLPPNRGYTHDLIIRGARVVLAPDRVYRLDLAFSYQDGVKEEGLVLSESGDLEGYFGYREVDAEGRYIHPGPKMVHEDGEGRLWLLLDAPADLTVREGPTPESPLLRTVRPDTPLSGISGPG
ncbi:MAG: M14 family metallopeptidase [bacterium]